MSEYGGNGRERYAGGDGCDTEAVSQPSGQAWEPASARTAAAIGPAISRWH